MRFSLKLFSLLLAAVIAVAEKNETVTMTTRSGTPVESADIKTLNSNLVRKAYYIDSITNFVRERIPERVWHANGAGAFGYFEVTDDITDICKAKLFNAIGKKTPVAVRFSTVINENGGTDNQRGSRGFAVKFYTEDGNYDILGLSVPVFVVKDPTYFAPFVHSQKRNPVTHYPDPNATWDFLTLHPETLHLSLMTFGDRGIPDGYRHMPGYGIHTFQVTNDQGVSSFIRYHFSPDAGIKNLFSDEAKKITGEDPDYAKRDLFNSIAEGYFPSWTLSIQALSLEDVNNATFDVFDVTKKLPLEKYPLRPVGKLVLDRNPRNYFADIEQLSFDPSHLVPGILGAPDKIFEARSLAYRDAQFHRLGPNYLNLPVNCPIHAVNSYTLDGIANKKSSPNYYPNSFNGPQPYHDAIRGELLEISEDEPNNFEQASEFYMEMTEDERNRLIENIVESLRKADKFLHKRAVKIFKIIHKDLGSKVGRGLKMKENEIN